MTWVRKAQDAFKALPAQEQPRILDALRELSAEPLRGPNVKKLKGKRRPCYRYRQGDYRILYEVFDGPHQVRVLGIVTRGEAYKKR